MRVVADLLPLILENALLSGSRYIGGGGALLSEIVRGIENLLLLSCSRYFLGGSLPWELHGTIRSLPSRYALLSLLIGALTTFRNVVCLYG